MPTRYHGGATHGEGLRGGWCACGVGWISTTTGPIPTVLFGGASQGLGLEGTRSNARMGEEGEEGEGNKHGSWYTGPGYVFLSDPTSGNSSLNLSEVYGRQLRPNTRENTEGDDVSLAVTS